MVEFNRGELIELAKNEKEENRRFSAKKSKYTSALIIFAVAVGVVWGIGMVFEIKHWSLIMIALWAIASIIYWRANSKLITSFYGRKGTGLLSSLRNAPFYMKFNSADTMGKIVLCEERLNKVHGVDFIVTASLLMEQYAIMDMTEKADTLFGRVSAFEPEDDFQRTAKLETLFAYYDFKNDDENCIRTFDEGEEVFRKTEWENPRLFMKAGYMSKCMEYLCHKNDHAKALGVYLLYADVLETAEGADANINKFLKEHREKGCISKASLYCHTGDSENAAKYYAEALEKHKDTDIPLVRKNLAETEKLLREKGII